MGRARTAARSGCGGAREIQLECPEADELVVVSRDEAPAAGATSDPHARPTQGALRAKNARGEVTGEFPLRHTEVAAEISGYVGKTVVEQTYANPFREVIEAVYVFPLPTMAAVNDFVMEVGERRIVGLIRPREEAERIYAEARARGQTASLLTQERPNIFTQSVANIEPGGQVKIRITYFETLSYEHDSFRYVFPMVVGPRYIPGTPGGTEPAATTPTPTPAGGAPSEPHGESRGTPTGGGGTSPPTDRVSDADRITPQVLRPGERSGHDIGLTVTLDAGLPITKLEALAHRVEIDEPAPGKRVVRLSAADAIPNKDFVLVWSVAGAETQFGVLAHRGEAGGFLTLMMQPPREPSDEQVTPREITFILDVSGSMSGVPIGISKEVVRRSLDKLRPDDMFNVFFFASGNGQLWDRPRRNTAENVAEARRFLDELCGGGGTEMLDGVRRALHAEHDPEYVQMFVFLTDGYVGNEAEILRLIKEERGGARFFGFGIGSSVNRYFIEGIAEHGGGMSTIVLRPDARQACPAIDRLFTAIDSPVLVDVSVEWNGLPVEDAYPQRLPDLFAGQTISLVARYTGPAQGTAYVRGRVGARRVSYPVPVVLPEREAANEALAPIWARWRIAELSKELLTAEEARQEELKRQITDLAVEFRLVSQYTAFVAVDESRVVGSGQPVRVVQPVELPEGVSYEGVFGERPAGEAVDVPAWGLTLQMTESGKVKVGAVTQGSAADRAGIEAGWTVTTVDRTAVHDLVHFEGLVLQGRGNVRVGFDPGGTVELPAPQR
jgi:Ca-activated chloride channel family protein